MDLQGTNRSAIILVIMGKGPRPVKGVDGEYRQFCPTSQLLPERDPRGYYRDPMDIIDPSLKATKTLEACEIVKSEIFKRIEEEWPGLFLSPNGTTNNKALNTASDKVGKSIEEELDPKITELQQSAPADSKEAAWQASKAIDLIMEKFYDLTPEEGAACEDDDSEDFSEQ